ncbi:MAG: potassium transporter [Muribaculaceae bacterium]|nr:potassium transporter [Muribaculaceae bacterium]
MHSSHLHPIAWLRRLRPKTASVARMRLRFRGTADRISAFMNLVVYLTAVVAVTAMLVYAGFEDDTIDRRLVIHVLQGAQIVFIVNVLFNLTFRTKAFFRDSLIISRVADFAILLTLIPLIFPHGSGIFEPVVHIMHNKYFLFSILAFYAVAEFSYGTMQLLGRRTNPSLILSTSFLLFIFIGSFVLMLPRCTYGNISYIDALFMASSAVSMTGLCTVDAAATFTPMGWFVIAILMQIGALGVLTFTSFFALFFSGKSSIYNQLLMHDFIYSKSMSQLMPVILYILGFTLTVEAAGAVAVYFSLPDGFLADDIGKRMAFAAFHSLSAFCNGGFCPLPDGLADPALMRHGNAFYLVTTVLIIAGGIGFPNLVNFKDVLSEYIRRIRARITGHTCCPKVHIYDLNTKLVLLFTALLFAGGAVMFYILEYNGAFERLSLQDKVVQSIFCSATVRTAGFNTYGPQSWLGVTFLSAMFLMWIGCSSQSMGGGIKVNAFAAVMLDLRSIVYGQKGVTAFGRKVSPDSIRRAYAVVCFSIFAVFAYSCLIMLMQPELDMKDVMFECFSAITTVGMSLGITPELSDVGKIAIASAMFLGRVGIISVLCGLVGNKPDISPMLLEDDIIIN